MKYKVIQDYHDGDGVRFIELEPLDCPASECECPDEKEIAKGVFVSKEGLYIKTEKKNSEESLGSKFIHYWDKDEMIGYKKNMEKLAQIARDHFRKHPEEIGLVRGGVSSEHIYIT